jgi:glutaminyl-peptide cyclotransferase
MRFFLLIIFAVFTVSCKTGTPANRSVMNNNSAAVTANKTVVAPNRTADKLPVYGYDIVKTYPHDPKAFTQGLTFSNGFLYEGTGGRQTDNYRSSLRKVEIDSGKILQKIDLDGRYFGEGITIFDGKIYQVTWQEQKGFVYDLNDFKLIKEFNYAGEGWGLTHDNANLIMSDGTHIIRFINPETFQTTRTITVLDGKGKPLIELNELEYVKGEIWANVWQEGWIARIDPANGKLIGRIDLEELTEEQMDDDRNADVLNGIAYDEATDRLFITGKKWRKLFEIKIKPKQ